MVSQGGYAVQAITEQLELQLKSYVQQVHIINIQVALHVLTVLRDIIVTVLQTQLHISLDLQAFTVLKDQVELLTEKHVLQVLIVKELVYMILLSVLHVILVNIVQVEEQHQMVIVMLDMSVQEALLLQHQQVIYLVLIIKIQVIIRMGNVLKDIPAQLDLIIQSHVLKVHISQTLANRHA